MPDPTKEWICYQELRAPADDQRERSPCSLFSQHGIPTCQSEHLEAFWTRCCVTRSYRILRMLQRQRRPPVQGQNGHGEDSQPPAVAASHHGASGSGAPWKTQNWGTALGYQRVTAFKGRSSSQQANLSIAEAKQFMVTK